MSRTQRPIALALATLAVAATVGALAGCSAAAPNASPKAASGGSSTPASAAASGKLDICSLLPVATVAQISGQDLTVAKPDHSLDSNGIDACSYETADGLEFIRVDVNNQTAKIAYDANYSTAGSNEDLSGLGDKAFGTMYHVEALFGDSDIAVLNQASASLDALEAIVQKVHSVI
jgi:hypothetical protein